jgi:hypothetical protein
MSVMQDSRIDRGSVRMQNRPHDSQSERVYVIHKLDWDWIGV